MMNEEKIKNAPNFTQEQIEFLERCMSLRPYPSYEFAIDEWTIEMLKREMIRRGLIKKEYKALF